MSRFPGKYAAGQPLVYFALTAVAIAAAWWWLGAPVKLPPSPLAPGEKLYCVSYAPFRDGQDPLVESTMIPPAQIDEDLALLSRFTDCVRTYSTENGLDQVAEIAQRYGMKVFQGLWLSNKASRNRAQIATTVALAKKFPDVIRAVIVGNEVLLRGEMSATDLGAILREVKSQITQPVTYADVWEFWLRYADLQNSVDFVTIHILPYWEDFPIPAAQAAAHVDAIRKRVAAAIPNKEIMIGETGWPSQGRMREGALPSPANQARVIEETLALGKRENFRVNVIEAFDQPWKRWLEGSTGRYWGIYDRATRGPRFTFGGAVSNHPQWAWLALAGIVLAALSFGAALVTAHVSARGENSTPQLWPRVAAFGFVSAVLFGWTIERVPIESYSAGGWLRSIMLGRDCGRGTDSMRRRLCAGRALPSFAFVVGRRGEQRDTLRHCARRHIHLAHADVASGGARSGFRPALSRLHIRSARGCSRSVSAPDIHCTWLRIACARRDRRCSSAGRLRHLHYADRDVRELAGDLVLRRHLERCGYSGAGAGRARLRIRIASVSAERSVLCRTIPKHAAESAIRNKTIDGRARLRERRRDIDAAKRAVG